jgi:GrpB-like predicted nucleotidyltransferase (UPF0157 family)
MDEVFLVESDPAWPDKFRAEAALVASIIGRDRIIAIEHIGSTAIPGLPAKPIIDIMVLVHELTDGLRAVPALEAIGYSYWRANPNKQHLRLVKGLPPAAPQRTHHLHVIADLRELHRHTLFRDYLRAHPEERAAYLGLKRVLAAQFVDDREAYTGGKRDYIDAAVDRARAWMRQVV